MEEGDVWRRTIQLADRYRVCAERRNVHDRRLWQRGPQIARPTESIGSPGGEPATCPGNSISHTAYGATAAAACSSPIAKTTAYRFSTKRETLDGLANRVDRPAIFLFRR
jgi:hypothetical protein